MDASATRLLIARLSASFVLLAVMTWFFFGRDEMTVYPALHREIVAAPLVAVLLIGGWKYLGQLRW